MSGLAKVNTPAFMHLYSTSVDITCVVCTSSYPGGYASVHTSQHTALLAMGSWVWQFVVVRSLMAEQETFEWT